MSAESYQSVPARNDKGWPEHGPLRYRLGTARHDKIGVALAGPDSTIISLDRNLFATTSELTNVIFSIL